MAVNFTVGADVEGGAKRASLNFTLEGLYFACLVSGNYRVFETNFAFDQLTDVVPLVKQWDPGLEASYPDNSADITDSQWGDVWAKYAADPESVEWKNFDEDNGESPRGYRKFLSRLTVKENGAFRTGVGWLYDGSTWAVNYDKKNLVSLTPDNGDIPSIRFRSSQEQAFKVLNLNGTSNDVGAVTSIKGFTTTVRSSPDFATLKDVFGADYYPWIALQKSRYRYEKAVGSFRNDFNGSQSNDVEIDEQGALADNADNQMTKFGTQNITGQIVLQGEVKIPQGETVGVINTFFRNQPDFITINSPIRATSYNNWTNETSVEIGRP